MSKADQHDYFKPVRRVRALPAVLSQCGTLECRMYAIRVSLAVGSACPACGNATVRGC